MGYQGSWEMVPFGLDDVGQYDDDDDNCDAYTASPEKRVEELRNIDAWFEQEAEKVGLFRRCGGSSIGSKPGTLSEIAAASADVYDKLVRKVGNEEKARRKISNDLFDLRREMNDLLSNARRPARMDGSDIAETVDAAARRRSKEQPEHQRVRPCACGCGALVRSGDPKCEGDMTITCAERLQKLETANMKFGPVPDARAQRAACERLSHRSEPKRPEQEVQSAPRRPLNHQRLTEMAKPREEKRPEEFAEKEGRKLLRSVSVPGPRWAPHASTQHDAPGRIGREHPSFPSNIYFPPITGGNGAQEVGTGRRSKQSANPLKAASVAVLAGVSPTRKRSMKLKLSEDTPGLSLLLDRRALEDPFGYAEGDNDDHSHMPFPSFAGEAPKKVRTVQSQQQYLQAHLYRKPKAKPGSLEALQSRLDELRSDRRAREMHAPDRARDEVIVAR